MEFPIAGVIVRPLYLAGVGFLVGILGAFFGVGGGFIAGPMMFITGVPMNFVVGTDLAHMTGKSIVAARKYRVLGHVDVKFSFIMIIGTIVGVESGAQLIEALECMGNINQVIGGSKTKGINRFIMDEVAPQIVDHTDCPVLIVRRELDE